MSIQVGWANRWPVQGTVVRTPAAVVAALVVAVVAVAASPAAAALHVNPGPGLDAINALGDNGAAWASGGSPKLDGAPQPGEEDVGPTSTDLYLTARAADEDGYPNDLVMWDAPPTGDGTQDTVAPVLGQADGRRSWIATGLAPDDRELVGTAALVLHVRGQLHVTGEIHARLVVLPPNGPTTTIAADSRMLSLAANSDTTIVLDLDVNQAALPAGSAVRLVVTVDGASGGLILEYDGAEAPSGIRGLVSQAPVLVRGIDDLPWSMVTAAGLSGTGLVLAMYGLAVRFRL